MPARAARQCPCYVLGRHIIASDGRCELRPRGNAELRENAVEVRAHRPMRDVQALANLAIGEALGSERRNLLFLLGELHPRLVLLVLSLSSGA